MSLVIPEAITVRRDESESRLKQVTGALKERLEAHGVEAGEACIYATGSGGRKEMHEHSDLDVFIVFEKSSGVGLRGIEVQAAVIQAFRKCKLDAPSRDGAFLAPHTKSGLTEYLGSPEDDAANRLTARMLLLLESEPLVGGDVYKSVLEHVISTYWEMSALHQDSFLPYMLTNDIIRYWRIVLLNHESNLRERQREIGERVGAQDEVLRRDRRYRSYKMRFARCATCFSALAYMLAATYESGNLATEGALEMVHMTPLQRLEKAASLRSDCVSTVQTLLDLYAKFLERVSAGKDALLQSLADDSELSATLSGEGTEFTSSMLNLIRLLESEKNAALARHMVI